MLKEIVAGILCITLLLVFTHLLHMTREGDTIIRH